MQKSTWKSENYNFCCICVVQDHVGNTEVCDYEKRKTIKNIL